MRTHTCITFRSEGDVVVQLILSILVDKYRKLHIEKEVLYHNNDVIEVGEVRK